MIFWVQAWYYVLRHGTEVGGISLNFQMKPVSLLNKPPSRTLEHMCMDKGYDYPEVYELLEDYGCSIYYYTKQKDCKQQNGKTCWFVHVLKYPSEILLIRIIVSLYVSEPAITR
jgi:hypothetical protein